MPGLLTFTSDFGITDSYVAEVKGVLKALDPELHIIDITHWLEPGNLTAAAFVLLHAFRYFAAGTVHLAVIDPGVGSERDILAVRTGRYVFVGPDNGILQEAVEADGGGSIFALEIECFFKKLSSLYRGNDVLQRIVKQGPSATFHGRDLFAPLSAYLCGGHPLEEVAVQKSSMVEYRIMRPMVCEDSVTGKVVYIDRFGNLITNVEENLVGQEDEIFLKTDRTMTLVGRLKNSYASAGRGAPIAIIGSRGLLEIAVSGGSAQAQFEADYGSDILVMKKQNGGLWI
jgi:S-adenosylmethionine hydrolase